MINCSLATLIVSLFSLCRLRITTQLRSGAVDKMTGIFTERIWKPCISQPNELKRESKKKTGGPWPTEAPLRIATATNWLALQ